MSGSYMRSKHMKDINGKAALSVEKRKYDSSWAFPDVYHWHDYYEIELFCTGSGTHYLSGRQTPFSAGYMFLVTPSDFHRLVSNGDAMLYYNINFNDCAIPEEIRAFITSYNAPAEVILTAEEISLISAELDKIHGESDSCDPFTAEYKLNCFGKVLVLFCRALIRQSGTVPSSLCQYNSAVRRAMDIVQRSFQRNIGLSSVASEIGYSPNYLGTLFVRETGMSFTEYLQNKRISYAENLLKNSSMSVREISEISGFSSPSYFISIFKKKRGCTPVSLRRG